MVIFSGIKPALVKSWQQYGQYTLWATLFGALVVFLVKRYPNKFPKAWGDDMNYWLIVIPVGLLAIVFVFYLGRFSEESVALKMEIIHPNPDDVDFLTGRKTYRIKVKNKHPRKIVKNLKVSIHLIKWPPSAEIPLGWYGIIFPYLLPEKNSNVTSSCELAGDSEKEFDLMFVNAQNSTVRMMNFAPFRPMHPESKSFVKFVVSDTVFPIEDLPPEDSKLIFTFKISGGDGDVNTLTESHILKVPPFAIKNGVAGAVEKMNAFMTDKSFYQYLPVFEKLPVVEKP